MMNENVLDAEVIEESEDLVPDEPLTIEQLMVNLMEDLVGDAGPATVADEFVEGFVETGRPEAGQVFALLDQPTPTLVALIKQSAMQSQQAVLAAIDKNGPGFVDDLKSIIRERLQGIAQANPVG